MTIRQWLTVERHPSYVRVYGRCIVCGVTVDMILSRTFFEAWEGGMNIQRAFPHMPEDEREWLISGLCGPCFDHITQEGE